MLPHSETLKDAIAGIRSEAFLDKELASISVLDSAPDCFRLSSAHFDEIRRCYAYLEGNVPCGVLGDPYVTSTAYLFSTGRRGLWCILSSDSPVFVCLHPNRRNHLIVFWPGSPSCLSQISRLLERLIKTGIVIHLARVPSVLEEKELTAGCSIALQKIDEEYLDWRFPVHTCIIKNLMQLRGKPHQKIRQAMNRYKDRLTIKPLNPTSRFDQMLIHSIGAEWEQSVAVKHTHQQHDECGSSFFGALLDLCRIPGTSVYGYLFSIDQDFVAFSILEAAHNGVYLAGQCIPGLPNLAEVVVYKTAEAAKYNHGCVYFCLGGSENDGMDRFKRKFSPDFSQGCSTFKVMSR